MPATRAYLQTAIDDALRDGVKRAFAVLIDGLIDAKSADAEQNPIGRFKAGIRRHLEAHAAACAVITELAPDPP